MRSCYMIFICWTLYDPILNFIYVMYSKCIYSALLSPRVMASGALRYLNEWMNNSRAQRQRRPLYFVSHELRTQPALRANGMNQTASIVTGCFSDDRTRTDGNHHIGALWRCLVGPMNSYSVGCARPKVKAKYNNSASGGGAGENNRVRGDKMIYRVRTERIWRRHWDLYIW